MGELFAVRRLLFAVSFGALLTVGSAQAGQVLVTNTNNSLAGSLRQAILDANAGDVIAFQIPTSDPGYDSLTHAYTINLTTAELIVSSNLTIDGGGQKITLQRVPPTNDLESAIVATLPANVASYTAIVRGLNNATGIAVVEVYALN